MAVGWLSGFPIVIGEAGMFIRLGRKMKSTSLDETDTNQIFEIVHYFTNISI